MTTRRFRTNTRFVPVATVDAWIAASISLVFADAKTSAGAPCSSCARSCCDPPKLNVTVTPGGTDANGLRGQEVRIHHPNGSVSGWTPSIGVAPPVAVTEVGTTYVELRSLDNNGNQSASTIQPMNPS